MSPMTISNIKVIARALENAVCDESPAMSVSKIELIIQPSSKVRSAVRISYSPVTIPVEER